MDEEKLIEAVRSYSCLWDVSYRGNKDIRARENAWKEVARAVGEGVSPEECSRKWKNLRDHFVRELKKKKVRSGDPGPGFISRWPFFEIMQFLSNSVRHRETHSNFNSSDNKQSTVPVVMDKESSSVDPDDSTLEAGSSAPSQSAPSTPSQSAPSTPCPSSPCPSIPRKRKGSCTEEAGPSKRRKRAQEDEIEEALLQTLKEVKEKQVQPTNPHHNFGLEVAERLQKLTPRQSAFAKVKIQQMLLEIEFPPEPYNHYGADF